MKVFNVVAMWDVYVIAEEHATAREAFMQLINELPPSEFKANETRLSQTIRPAWHEQKPLVATDVSEDDFQAIRGKTTLDIFNHIYSKRG
jgi:hypothetical protein